MNKFTEKLDKVELKEVEVTGWKELGMEIPMHRELVERWGSPPRKKGDLDLDDVLSSDVAPLSHPVRRVKVEWAAKSKKETYFTKSYLSLKRLVAGWIGRRAPMQELDLTIQNARTAKWQ